MFDLTDKTALVTGATGGIGSSIAKAFHSAGATVAVSGRQVDKLDSLVGELGDRAYALPCDLADREAVGKLIEQAIEKLGRLDILVNNAGITRDAPFHKMTPEQWHQVIDTNLTGV
ncbi:MAG: SDR family NAD(P)-dependent oxidoreductase, partial [Pseudomonadota bacterium]